LPPVLLHRFFGAILAAAVGIVPLVPPEHVHEIEDDHGHVEFVVHWHAQAHGVFEEAEHHDHGRAVDHTDPPIATLDQAFVLPSVARLALPAGTTPSTLPEPTVSPRIAFAGYIERLIHGPPRAPTFQRGPPSLPSC
jgi:hypothetical protein